MAKDVKNNVVSFSERYARKCVANPVIDSGEVVPDCAVSIDDMLQTGVVKNSGETLDNNGIDDPNAIIGRVRDVFDAIDASRVVKKYGKKPAAAESAVKEAVGTSDNTPS